MVIGQRKRKRDMEDSTNACSIILTRFKSSCHLVLMIPVGNTAMMMNIQVMTIVMTCIAPSNMRGLEEKGIEKPLR